MIPMGDDFSRLERNPMPKKKTALQDSYPDAECPDCGEPIPEDTSDGDSCCNCNHVFYTERK
jgi:hypothetical protein